MKHSSKIVDYLKSHLLMLAVVLFIASCVIVPYRVKWTHKESVDDLAAGYYLLFDEPTGGQAMWRIRNELPIEFEFKRFIPSPPNRKSELVTNDLTYFKERIRKERIRSEHVSSVPSAPQTRPSDTDYAAYFKPPKGTSDGKSTDADLDAYLASGKSASNSKLTDAGLDAYLASAGQRPVARTELDSNQRVAASKDSIALAPIIDSIFHEDSIRYEHNVRGNESEIAGRKMASALNATVRLDFGRMIPQVGLTAFLCLLALLKTKKSAKSDSEH